MNWYLLGVQMNLGHAHKTRFWYLLGVFSKFSNEHPRHLYRRVPPEFSSLLSFNFTGEWYQSNCE